MSAYSEPLPVVPGYDYALRMRVIGPSAVFPAGCRIRSAVRHYAGERNMLAELTTENGGISRIDNETIDVRLTAEATDKIRHNTIVMDFARVDLDPDVYLYVLLSIPVILPVTKRAV